MTKSKLQQNSVNHNKIIFAAKNMYFFINVFRKLDNYISNKTGNIFNQTS